MFIRFITLIKELRRGTPTMQQSLALVLSVVSYDTHPKSFPQGVAYLLDTLKPTVGLFHLSARRCLVNITRSRRQISKHAATAFKHCLVPWLSYHLT